MWLDALLGVFCPRVLVLDCFSLLDTRVFFSRDDLLVKRLLVPLEVLSRVIARAFGVLLGWPYLAIVEADNRFC